MIFGKAINRYYLKHAPVLLLGILSLLTVDYIQLLIPELYRLVINGVNLGQVVVDGQTLPFTREVLFQHICLPMIWIVVLMVIGRFLWRVCFFGSAVSVAADLRERMFDHSRRLSQQYYQVNKVGNLMSLYTNDLDTIQECFGDGILMFFDAAVLGIMALVKMWRMDCKLTLLALIPAAYMAMMIPAFWGGKSLHHALTVYTAQASTYNFMTVNGPSLYNFLPASMDRGMLYTMFSGMAMALGMAMLAIVCLMVCLHREHITREGTLLTCLLVLGGVPFFLPKMHERYTFGADVLALAIAAYNPKRVWLPLLFGLSSYICYTAGLPGDAIFDLKWATVFQGAAVALTAAALYRSLNEEKAEAALAEVKA